MTDSDPIFDLDRCAQALAHGHDPAEIAVHLQGIIERLRRARGAEDERRDVLAFIKDEAGKFAAQAIADGWSERARDRLEGKASVLATILGYIDRGDHVRGD